jgi:hypothetical protein
MVINIHIIKNYQNIYFLKGYINLTTTKKLLKKEVCKMANNSGSNRIVVPEARAALNQMKLEIANELGMTNYNSMDKGNLTSRQNGYVGGYMVKKLVESAQNQLAGK